MAKKLSKKKANLKSKPRYACGVCGLAISVDNICGCSEACDIICCGEQMKKK